MVHSSIRTLANNICYIYGMRLCLPHQNVNWTIYPYINSGCSICHTWHNIYFIHPWLTTTSGTVLIPSAALLHCISQTSQTTDYTIHHHHGGHSFCHIIQCSVDHYRTWQLPVPSRCCYIVKTKIFLRNPCWSYGESLSTVNLILLLRTKHNIVLVEAWYSLEQYIGLKEDKLSSTTVDFIRSEGNLETDEVHSSGWKLVFLQTSVLFQRIPSFYKIKSTVWEIYI